MPNLVATAGVFVPVRSIVYVLMLCLFLGGCSGVLHKPSPEAKELAATLSYVTGDRPVEPGSGIVSVGNYYFSNGYPRLVHLAPGKREIGFYCDGQIYVDGPPTITHDFAGGQRYELYCEKGRAHIRQVQSASLPPEGAR
ncbi:hypothetical protein [Dyella sp.]|uniref:hypothetical protein n=1 Tax=Dyella sp. TaxID=1869338 RepID=UPI003F7D3857